MSLKKKHQEEHENLERWLVSYADFVTLLFAFFTTMYALSLTDKAKYQSAIESIQKAFLSGGGIFPLKGVPFSPYEMEKDKGSEIPPSPADTGKHSKSDIESLNRTAYQMRVLFEKSSGLSMHPGDLEIYRSENAIKIRLGEHLLFSPGSDKLKRQYVPFLVELSKRLARIGAKIQVEGHADSSPNESEDNWHLSLQRAYNLGRFMVEGASFPKELLSISGFGDTKPIADNDSPEGRARNRRVEIAILTDSKEMTQFLY